MTDIVKERGLLNTQGLDIHTREEWNAVQSYTSDRIVYTPVEGFVLHISVTIDHGDLTGDEHKDLRTIERIGQERFGIGFPYNAAVFDTGRLYEGQPLTRRGAHTVNDKNTAYKSPMNYWWRAIVLPQMVTDDVTEAQVHQCAKWAAAQIRAGYAKADALWIGHRDVAWKDCPGDAGYAQLPKIRELTKHYVANGLNPEENRGKMLYLIKTKSKAAWWLTDWLTKRHIASREEAAVILYAAAAGGAPVSTAPDGGPHVLGDDQQDVVDRIPRNDI